MAGALTALSCLTVSVILGGLLEGMDLSLDWCLCLGAEVILEREVEGFGLLE